MTDQQEGGAPLRQAERYGGPASDGKRVTEPTAADGGVKIAVISSFAMLGATLLTSILGAPSWLAFALGLVVFVLVAARLRAGGGGALTSPGRALSVDRAAATAAGLDPDAAQQRLDEAQGRLERINRLAGGLGQPALAGRVRAMTDEIRETLIALAADPSDIDMARKFLVVTIPSAEAAMEKYAGLGVRDEALSERFSTLMDEVAEAAGRQRAALRRDDALALEVEMEVLAERLRQS